MEAYYQKRPRAQSTEANGLPTQERLKALATDFDRYRQTLVKIDDDQGWASELRRYLKDRPADVTKHTDIVEWWQVSQFMTTMINWLTGITIGRIMPHCTRHWHV